MPLIKMSTHLFEDPTTATATTITVHNPTVDQPQQQLVQSEGTHGQSRTDNKKSYPSAAAEYEDVAQNAEIFWETLQGFHRSFGTKFIVPTIGGKALDLHRLFLEVTSRGGLEKVIRDRRWKEVIVVSNFPTTVTNASFALRKYYLSLLYHFEQVYYFRKQVPTISMADPLRNSVKGSVALHVLEGGATMNQLLGQASPILQPGCSVTGTIDGKFDNGYLITVNLGSDELKGVLYHIPHVLHMSRSSNTSAVPPHRNRKKYQDPSRPKPNRSGYNFFFAEHYARLKPLYHGQEKAISKKIGLLWSKLTEAEKQVYQEKGLRDKERYKTEMLQYRSSNNSKPQ